MALARPSRLTVDEDLPEKLREHIDEPDPRRAARPTKALPGTPEYLAVMESRAAAGQPLRGNANTHAALHYRQQVALAHSPIRKRPGRH